MSKSIRFDYDANGRIDAATVEPRSEGLWLRFMRRLPVLLKGRSDGMGGSLPPLVWVPMLFMVGDLALLALSFFGHTILLLLFWIIWIPSILMIRTGSHVKEWRERDEMPPLNPAPSVATRSPASSLYVPPFARPLPIWGSLGAFDDFDDYLRAQMGEAIRVVAADPNESASERLLELCQALFADRFTKSEVLIKVGLPAGWSLPAFIDSSGGYYANGFQVVAGSDPWLEILYQPFGEDLTVIRMALR